MLSEAKHLWSFPSSRSEHDLRFLRFAQNDNNERLLDDPTLDFVPASAQDDRNKL
jgi:hypothetical protein